MWHYCLGHIRKTRIKKLQESNLLGLLDCNAIETCELCLVAKMTKNLFKEKDTRTKDLLKLIQLDVYEPTRMSARDGFRYFITF
jgi:hypothetical protein